MPRGVYDRSKNAEKHVAQAAPKAKPGPKPGHKKPGPKPGSKYKQAAAAPAIGTGIVGLGRHQAGPSVDGDAGRRLDILLNYQQFLAQHEKGSSAYRTNLIRIEKLAEVVQISKEVEAAKLEEHEEVSSVVNMAAPAFAPVPVPQNAAPYIPASAPPAIQQSSAGA